MWLATQEFGNRLKRLDKSKSVLGLTPSGDVYLSMGRHDSASSGQQGFPGVYQGLKESPVQLRHVGQIWGDKYGRIPEMRGPIFPLSNSWAGVTCIFHPALFSLSCPILHPIRNQELKLPLPVPPSLRNHFENSARNKDKKPIIDSNAFIIESGRRISSSCFPMFEERACHTSSQGHSTGSRTQKPSLMIIYLEFS